MPWLYQFVLLTVLTVIETIILPAYLGKTYPPKIAKRPLSVDVHDEDVMILLNMINFRATWLKILGEMTFGQLDRIPIQGSKKLEFQLVLWASNSHTSLSRGHLLLVLVYVFVRGWLSWSNWALKVTCPARRKSTCPRLLDGNFSSPARYVRVRYLHIRVASYWQSPKLAPSEGQA